jgi:hypothetical protein
MRYDYGCGDKPCEAPLLFFVYDIPYFTSCDVFPSYDLINKIFKAGTNGGGMSPGTTWEPFAITEEEFENLKNEIKNTPIEKIQVYSRYADVPFIIDPSFDHLKDRTEWSREVCKQYGAQWLRRVNPEIYGKMDDQALRKVLETMTKEAPNRPLDTGRG